MHPTDVGSSFSSNNNASKYIKKLRGASSKSTKNKSSTCSNGKVETSNTTSPFSYKLSLLHLINLMYIAPKKYVLQV